MTVREVEHFKVVIPKKVEEILNSKEIGASDVSEIKIEIDWNLYNEPVITTTTKSIHTDVLENIGVKEER